MLSSSQATPSKPEETTVGTEAEKETSGDGETVDSPSPDSESEGEGAKSEAEEAGASPAIDAPDTLEEAKNVSRADSARGNRLRRERELEDTLRRYQTQIEISGKNKDEVIPDDNPNRILYDAFAHLENLKSDKSTPKEKLAQAQKNYEALLRRQAEHQGQKYTEAERKIIGKLDKTREKYVRAKVNAHLFSPSARATLARREYIKAEKTYIKMMAGNYASSLIYQEGEPPTSSEIARKTSAYIAGIKAREWEKLNSEEGRIRAEKLGFARGWRWFKRIWGKPKFRKLRTIVSLGLLGASVFAGAAGLPLGVAFATGAGAWYAFGRFMTGAMLTESFWDKMSSRLNGLNDFSAEEIEKMTPDEIKRYLARRQAGKVKTATESPEKVEQSQLAEQKLETHLYGTVLAKEIEDAIASSIESGQKDGLLIVANALKVKLEGKTLFEHQGELYESVEKKERHGRWWEVAKYITVATGGALMSAFFPHLARKAIHGVKEAIDWSKEAISAVPYMPEAANELYFKNPESWVSHVPEAFREQINAVGSGIEHAYQGAHDGFIHWWQGFYNHHLAGIALPWGHHATDAGERAVDAHSAVHSPQGNAPVEGSAPAPGDANSPEVAPGTTPPPAPGNPQSPEPYIPDSNDPLTATVDPPATLGADGAPSPAPSPDSGTAQGVHDAISEQPARSLPSEATMSRADISGHAPAEKAVPAGTAIPKPAPQHPTEGSAGGNAPVEGATPAGSSPPPASSVEVTDATVATGPTETSAHHFATMGQEYSSSFAVGGGAGALEVTPDNLANIVHSAIHSSDWTNLAHEASQGNAEAVYQNLYNHGISANQMVGGQRIGDIALKLGSHLRDEQVARGFYQLVDHAGELPQHSDLLSQLATSHNPDQLVATMRSWGGDPLDFVKAHHLTVGGQDLANFETASDAVKSPASAPETTSTPHPDSDSTPESAPAQASTKSAQTTTTSQSEGAPSPSATEVTDATTTEVPPAGQPVNIPLESEEDWNKMMELWQQNPQRNGMVETIRDYLNLTPGQSVGEFADKMRIITDDTSPSGASLIVSGKQNTGELKFKLPRFAGVERDGSWLQELLDAITGNKTSK